MTRKTGRLAVLAAVGVFAAGIAGCTGPARPAAQTVTVTVPPADPATAAQVTAASLPTGSSTQATPPGTTSARPAQASQKAFSDAFAKVRPRLSGPASVALVPVGGGESLSAGDLPTGVAWSTSKVPLAIAALHNGASPTIRGDVRTAIRDSDNASAERLWSGLGDGETASAAMQDVLREAGDAATRVPSRRIRPPYTAFGQTMWSSQNAAVFASGLPCLSGSAEVLDDMRDVSGTQQWGFWNVTGSAVKGGWGPVGRGYLVRQIAVVPTDGGHVGAAAMVQAASFEAGQRDLDAIAKWAGAHLRGLGGVCR